MHLWSSRCAASSAASCRGNSCRVSGAGMIVALFRRFATFFLALMGSSEGSFTESNSVFAWLGLSARGFLVASDGVCASWPACGWSALPLHAGSSCTVFNSSLCVSFSVSLLSILSCPRLVDRVSVFRIFHGVFNSLFQCFTVPCLFCERNTGAHVNVSLFFPF